jgi:hypothetical protein
MLDDVDLDAIRLRETYQLSAIKMSTENASVKAQPA